MKSVLQRVTSASVTLKSTRERREIGAGLVCLIGIAPTDTEADARWMAEKVAHLRMFEDENGKMNRGLIEIDSGAVLIVSQFTLLGETRKGRRPSFTGAAPPTIAIPLYETFVKAVQEFGVSVKTGEFGADMLVEIANDGPITLLLETSAKTHYPSANI